MAAVMITAAVCADGFNASGYVRAGIASTVEKNPKLTTNKWLDGIYFTGDSEKTRGRLNLSYDSTNDNGSYGAFVRLQSSDSDFTLKDDFKSAWDSTHNLFSYADVYAGFLGNKVTFAAGKLIDNWIESSGFEGYSVLDGLTGGAVTISPIAGLNLTGAAVIDYSKNDDKTAFETKKESFLGGARYTNDVFAASLSGAGYGAFTADLKYTGIKGLSISAEGEYETADGRDVLGGQELVTNLWVEYTGIDKLTLGLLSFQYYNQKAIDSDNDFTLTVTPAAAYQVNAIVKLSAEGTYTQAFYDDAPDAYAVITPAVTLAADKTASANIWASISTDTDQTPTSIGMGVKKTF